MKKYILLLLLIPSLTALSQSKNSSLKSILLQQLKSTHNVKDWFVPVNIAVDGLTAGQATSVPKEGNHSVGQLAYHLLFWNERQLKKFKGEKEDPFNGDNTETFDKFSEKQWSETVKKLDEVLTEIENLVENASDEQLNVWAPTIANISTHNAYHIGEMVYLRKLQGMWDPDKGVK